FVCTGSEANDLAWRLARAVTGKSGVIVSRHAYHGNTTFLSTLDAYLPGMAADQASVATIPVPVDASGDGFENALDEAIAALERSGHGVAAIYIDTCFANESLVAPDPAVMARAMARLKAAGGLYIADEVQAGLGRLGDVMWGFQSFAPIPDIVTMGKPLGNGHPIGAVATRRDILEQFCERQRYFNTFAGNPVSCRVGLAVLDVLQRDRLSGKAIVTGRHLATALDHLAHREPAIAAVRGRGLFQGVAFHDPATARDVMNEMARRGVLVGLTGKDREMLKIRPPMVFDQPNADQLA